ncbi:hypothetical protein DEU56DRAFT_321380 [Suillus clintonianus]|uniref:uncharacterized protein n=1 Tax=Suillus clintonianus TaxID=1904413 RepID=UPI001B85EDA4|nr:uncharacterized protein DEU56DRAFT_321380 [Suillus clintonianus]KAG2155729.1 hypothetical protein DEU56DRAFT_321380 [Suillus clintonianus]
MPCERTVFETCYAYRHLTCGHDSGLSSRFGLELLHERHHQQVSSSRLSLSAAVLQRYKNPSLSLQSLPTSLPAFYLSDHFSAPFHDFHEPLYNILTMRFLSLYIVFVSFSLALLLSGGVHGIPVSVSNPNASPRHAEVHRSDDITGGLLSDLLKAVTALLGSLPGPAAQTLAAPAIINPVQNLTSSLPLPGLPVLLGAVEAADFGSSYSSSSTVQASSTASPSQASSAAASASAVHQQADVHPGRGRHVHRRDTTSAPASLSSGSVYASSTSASGSVPVSPAIAPSAIASAKPALAVVTPIPSLPVSPPVPTLPAPLPAAIPPLPVSPPAAIPPIPVSLPAALPSLPASLPAAIPVLAASGMPTASGTTKGKRTRRNTHHR